jgi:hypothetical protein
MPYNNVSPIYINPQTTADVAILVAMDSGFTNVLQAILKKTIASVHPVFNATPGDAYPYRTLTQLVIETNSPVGHSTFTVELQNVQNQATWNLGTLAAANPAVNDILASIP